MSWYSILLGFTLWLSAPSAWAHAPASPSSFLPLPVAESSDRELRLRGHLKFSFRIARQRTRTADNVGGLEFSDLSFKMDMKIQKGVRLKARYQITPIKQELREAYASIKRPWFFERVYMGLQKRLFALDSDLETDSLNKIAFYKMRDLSLIAIYKFNARWRWGWSFSNGAILDDKDISPRRYTKQDVIMADTLDERQGLGGNARELATSIEYKKRFSKHKRLLVTGFTMVSNMSDDEAQSFATLSEVPGDTGVNTGQSSYIRTGFNLDVRTKKHRIYSQLISAQVRKLQRDLFAIEWSHYRKHWHPSLAYSQQYLSTTPDPLFPMSWNRKRYTAGVHWEMKEGMKFLVEVTVNEEETGGHSIPNDEAIAMWIYNF